MASLKVNVQVTTLRDQHIHRHWATVGWGSIVIRKRITLQVLLVVVLEWRWIPRLDEVLTFAATRWDFKVISQEEPVWVILVHPLTLADFSSTPSTHWFAIHDDIRVRWWSETAFKLFFFYSTRGRFNKENQEGGRKLSSYSRMAC